MKAPAIAVAIACHLRLVDTSAQATVGDDLDGVLGNQQVDQHAVVFLGVPDTELPEQRHRALTRRTASKQFVERQAGFDTETYLSTVLPLARGDGVLETVDCTRAEAALDVALVE